MGRGSVGEGACDLLAVHPESLHYLVGRHLPISSNVDMTMRRSAIAPAVIFSAAYLAGATGCGRAPAEVPRAPAIVGTWLVNDPNAPFPYHLYVFNADGTMQQANPDAGDPRTSDSDGKGAWIANGATIDGTWVEVTADRATHRYAGRLEVTFRFTVFADSLTGSERVSVFDASGQATAAPATSSELTGARVTARR